MPSYFAQSDHHVRFGWGPTEAAELADPDGCLVVVDVLSFSTAVTVAVDRGSAVFPYRWRDDSAIAFARRHDAVLAVGRRAVDADHPWSLSPAALATAPVAARLVLPSPNGSTIAASAAGGTVLAGCLRNRTAVGQWLRDNGFGTAARPVTVIAAGERWPDGGLRPCLEDLLGAGGILAALGDGPGWSPEALAARACFTGTADPVASVTDCGGGRELIERGFGGDVGQAVDLDTTTTVPLLTEEAFRPA